ncbi:Required for respiratory growth protein 9 mitochondrial [Orbilia brochopaga]|uniref:Required for respiratory growth protein 9, mitochondrial n=1 Tax=Orbilia brochopaga TaxID=3140254 RepID=A0AAV9VC35_9PEZI
MNCSQCRTRLLRSFITATADLSLPTTAASTTSRRYLSRTSIRQAYMPLPSNESAELSTPTTVATSAPDTPDFLALYTNAKKNPNKEALTAWSNSWKPETDLSAIRSSSLRLIPESSSTNKPKRGNWNIEGGKLTGFDFLDEFTSSAVSTEANVDVDSEAAYEELKSSKYNDQVDPIPTETKRGFPTRARGDVAADMDSDGMIPWEDAAGVEQRLQDAEDPDAAAWRDLSTPELWARSKKRRLARPDDLPSGSKFSGRLALGSPSGVVKFKPANSVDVEGGSAAEEKSERAPGTPSWKVHKDAVKAKHGGKAWDPFARLSPAAVATLKQLREENPGMTVEEFAPIFKISPDAMRRILRSKWTPTKEEEEDRMERWRRRGDSIWEKWVENGMVVTRASKHAAKEERIMSIAKQWRARKEAKEKQGFILRKDLNLKNRIL